jgi:outer membrane protein W
VSGFVGLTASDMNGKGDKYSFLHLDLGVRYHFANASKPFVPFVDVGVARRSATRNDIILTGPDGVSHGGQLKMSGAGFTVGGGFNYFVRPKVAVSTAVNWAMGDFTDLKFGEESPHILAFSGTTARLNVGVVWFPRK